MIKTLIDYLNTGDFYGVSKSVDIAKGIKEVPYTFKGAWKQIKRIYKSK
jgi:hypothetical protein